MRWLDSRLAPCILCVAGFGAPPPATTFLPPTPNAFPEEDVDDEEIRDTIEDQFVIDPVLPLYAVDIEVDQGVVKLEGRVANLRVKERCAKTARAVRGVRAVVDLLEVTPVVDASPGELEGDVRRALLSDPATESFEVTVSAADEGRVSLRGEVDSWAERTLCGSVARGVRGVRSVRNEIDVRPAERRTDMEIQNEVERILEWDALVDHALIDVAVSDGVVTLKGIVGSGAEKERARSNAFVMGAEEVEVEELVVRGWAEDPRLRKTENAPRRDEEIEKALVDALERDPRVAAYDLSVTSLGAVVTLRGVVDNLKARRAAERDARYTTGVASVRNRIKVRPKKDRRDEEVRAAIVAAFEREPFLDRHRIDVEVHDGLAYLRGQVDSNYERSLADDQASKIRGVLEVVNHLDVHDPRPRFDDPWLETWDTAKPSILRPHTLWAGITDEQIETEIENQWKWSPFIDHETLDVSVDDGVATVKGTVGSVAERQSVLRNAYEGGALWVDHDDLVTVFPPTETPSSEMEEGSSDEDGK